MSWPYIYSSSFDTGDNSEWDSEQDTGTLLDFPHYSTLAALPGAPAPYHGAYCLRIIPGDTNDHTVTEGDLDIADTATRWIRFALYVSRNFTATADDIFNLFEWQSAGAVVEACIGMQITAATDEVEIGIADGTAVSSGWTSLSKGTWHVIEALFTVDVTPGTGDVLELYVDGGQVQRVTGGAVAAAISNGVLGTQDTLSTTGGGGYLLIDEFAFDDTRLSLAQRWTTHRLLTTSAFAFVGPGCIENVKVLDGGSGDVICELYDTDVYQASMTPIWRDRTSTANVNLDAADVPIKCSRGCLVKLSGTLPGAIIDVGQAVAWGSDGAVRSYGLRRTSAPGDL